MGRVTRQRVIQGGEKLLRVHFAILETISNGRSETEVKGGTGSQGAEKPTVCWRTVESSGLSEVEERERRGGDLRDRGRRVLVSAFHLTN
jgi:hypothetical protein